MFSCFITGVAGCGGGATVPDEACGGGTEGLTVVGGLLGVNGGAIGYAVGGFGVC